MIELNMTFWIQLVNFLITLAVLNWLLIRPIREVIKKRGDAMAALAQEAQVFSGNAQEKLAGYESALAEARRKAGEERDAMKLAGQQEEKSIMEAAQQEAQAALAQARKSLAGEVEGALSSLRTKVSPLAAQAAAKVLS